MTIQERNELLKDIKIGGLHRKTTEKDKWEIANFVQKIIMDKNK